MHPGWILGPEEEELIVKSELGAIYEQFMKNQKGLQEVLLLATSGIQNVQATVIRMVRRTKTYF